MNGPPASPAPRPPGPVAPTDAGPFPVRGERWPPSAVVAMCLLALQATGAAVLTVLLLLAAQEHRRQEWLGDSMVDRRLVAGLVLAGVVVGMAAALAGLARRKPWGRWLTYVVETVVVADHVVRAGARPERAVFGVTLAVAVVVLVALTPRAPAPAPGVPGPAPPDAAPPVPEPEPEPEP